MPQVQLATFGIWELVLILAIVLIIFGAGKLPMLGDSLGKGIRNFRKSFKDEPKEVEGQARRIEQEGQPEKLPPSQATAQQQPEKDKVESPAENG